jgi:hypothetical protein
MSRPFTAASVAGTAAHHGFELAAGVGLVWQPEIGLPGSLAMWGTALPAGFVVAARSDTRWEPLLAFSRGASVAGVVTHFLLWPWKRKAGVLPWLTEAEGLRGRQIPAYNVVLHLWGAAAVVALVKETPRRSRRWALLGLASVLLFRKSAEYHFRWATEQAKVNPQWWNRGLRA